MLESPFGSALADEKSKNAKVTLVYQHELPNVPGNSIKGVLVEHARAATRLATRMPNLPSSTRPCSKGPIRSQVNNGPVTTYTAGQSWSEMPGDRHGVSANASQTQPAKLLAVFVVDTNGTDYPIRELRS